SLRLLRFAFPAFRPQPRQAAQRSLSPSQQRPWLFRASPCTRMARRDFPPKQVRHPTDCRFTSGCSPPRLAAAQLPSITWLRPTAARTPTVLTKRPRGRTCAGLQTGIPAAVTPWHEERAGRPALSVQHRQVEALLLRAVDGDVVARIGVAHHAGGGIVGE